MKQEITLDEIRKKAEQSWEGCHHCDAHDKAMWINGFIHGFLNGQDDIQIVAIPSMTP
tara:strand:+ start:85 stop:258 length:174 start_codon:yes stop_codon:yes gene_type:complete